MFGQDPKYGLIILVILSIFMFYNFLKYQKFYLGKIYDIRIKQAEKSGDYIKAENFYKKKIFLTDDFFSKERALNELIRFYIDQKLYNEALKLYLEEKLKTPPYLSFPIYECKSFIQEINLVTMYNEIAYLYIKTNNIEKAETYANKANHILRTIDKKYDYITGKKLIETYKNFVYIELKQNNYTEAKKYLDEIKKILTSHHIVKKEGQSAFFDYYDALYCYYMYKKDYSSAKSYVEKLFFSTSSTNLPLEIVSEINSQSRYLIYFNKNLGEIYYKTKEYVDAQRHYEIAYNLSNELNGKYQSDTICAKYQLFKIYKKQNRQEISKRYIDEIKNETRGNKILKDINNDNFEKELDNFCNYISP